MDGLFSKSLSPLVLLSPRDVRYLERELLDARGELRLRPLELYLRFAPEDLRWFCFKHQLYALPTEELALWMKTAIAGRPAIEIGAGRSNLGRALGIKSTDAFIYETPEMQQFERSTGQLTPRPSHDVERMEAIEAVERFRPEVVVGAWITHRFDPEHVEEGDSPYGVDEPRLLRFDFVQTYILIGNDLVHSLAQKRIRRLPHSITAAPWLLSRSQRQELNRIYVWETKDLRAYEVGR